MVADILLIVSVAPGILRVGYFINIKMILESESELLKNLPASWLISNGNREACSGERET